MNEVVIQVDHLWKKYRLGVASTGTLAHDFNRWLHRIAGKPDPYAKIDGTHGPRAIKQEPIKGKSACNQSHHGAGVGSDRSGQNERPTRLPAFMPELAEGEMWALRDICFEVKQGEILGVIGKNGAGKSTLLKILSRVTAPTGGEVRLKGRVASLLEIGTGFHPDLTGRENIYLNGAILGMSKEEIKKNFDRIVAFAEVEKFIDTPVKRYSSGLYVRLAFAVAAHLEAEIIILDEVLAVGDASFQKKCLGKMDAVSKEGRTVIFVSHNMLAIKSLCQRVLMLQSGAVHFDSEASLAVSSYIEGDDQPHLEVSWDSSDQAPGNDELKLRCVRVVAAEQGDNGGLYLEQEIQIIIEYWNRPSELLLHITLMLYTADEVCVFSSISEATTSKRGLNRSTCTIPANLLNDEQYRLRIVITKHTSRVLLDLDRVVSFSVHEKTRDINWFGKILGTVRPKLTWKTEQLPPGVGL